MPTRKDTEEIARLRKELVDVLRQVGDLDPALHLGELRVLQKRYQDIRAQILKLEAKSED
ncbi:MAG TPA: hypothetical protein VMF90_13325 [Rhizobiaceae bacterium]|nr:hypothetical protein [Rhizobiaceae bacterium]